jgi:superfamily II DNA or RNA helicase
MSQSKNCKGNKVWRKGKCRPPLKDCKKGFYRSEFTGRCNKGTKPMTLDEMKESVKQQQREYDEISKQYEKLQPKPKPKPETNKCRGNKVWRNGKCRPPLKPCVDPKIRNAKTNRCRNPPGFRRPGKRVKGMMTRRQYKLFKEELRLKSMKRKKGDVTERSTLPLQEHQIRFADSFINKDAIDGAIAIHGVGTGKTLTAVASAEMYLDRYPKSNVTVITPASLLAGFKQELYKFDPAIEADKRYKFYTYDGYLRRGKTKDCQKSLVIIDEGQNLRTGIIVGEGEPQLDDDGNVIGKGSLYAEQGAKPFKIINRCTRFARKILILSATPMVNKPEDMTNLINMANALEWWDNCKKAGAKNDPLISRQNKNCYSIPDNLMDSELLLNKYVRCRLSFFEADPEVRKKFYPKSEEIYVPFYMNQKDEKEYAINTQTREQEAFFNGARRISNELPYKANYTIKLIQHVLDNKPSTELGLTQEVLNKHNNKVVIFTHFREYGADLITPRLRALGIPYGVIDGSVTKDDREQIVNDYVSGKINVILISKAGAEGLNLLGTGYIILFEPSWNNTEQEQVKGRGVRFKSHMALPEEKRNVLIINLFTVFKSDKKDFDNWMKALKNGGVEGITKQLEKQRSGDSAISEARAKRDNRFDKLLQKLPDYILKKTDDITNRMIGKNDFGDIRNEIINYLKDIPSNDIKNKNDLIRKLQNITNTIDKFDKSSQIGEWGAKSIDLKLFAKANIKQFWINKALKELKGLESLEDCTATRKFFENIQAIPGMKYDEMVFPPPSPVENKLYLSEMNEGLIEEFNINVNDKRQLNIRKLQSEMFEIADKEFRGQDLKVKKYNANYSSRDLSWNACKLAGIDKFKNGVVFLEPTAGSGRLLLAGLEMNNKAFCVACEPLVRFQKFLSKIPRTVVLKDKNFLAIPPPRNKFKCIVMNPPFNIGKGMALPDRSAKDVDFILHAFNNWLDSRGIMVCILSTAYTFRGLQKPGSKDYNIYQPFRDLLENHSHHTVPYEKGFAKDLLTTEQSTDIDIHLIKIIK